MKDIFKKRELFWDFSKTLSGNVVNSGSVFIATMLIVRTFSKGEFAQIGASLAYSFVLAKVLDAGITFSALRFSSLKRSEERYSYLGAMYVVISLLAVATFYFVSGFGRYVISEPPSHFIVPSIATAWAIAFQAALRCHLQSLRDYRSVLIYQVLCGILRLIITAAFWLKYLSFQPILALLALYFLPVVLASLPYMNRVLPAVLGFLSKVRIWRLIVREMVSYAFWVWLSGMLFVLTLRAPIFFLERIHDTNGVAVLSAVLSFISLIALVNDAARAVMIPRSVIFITQDEYTHYINKVTLLSWRLFWWLSPVVIIAGIMIIIFLPKDYLPDSYLCFYGLAFSIVGTSILGMVTNLVHALGKPRAEAITNLIRAVSVSLGCFLLGAFLKAPVSVIATFTGVTIIAFELMLFQYVRKQVRSLPL
jgi:O-antigen/teichoic acid export membrane protein